MSIFDKWNEQIDGAKMAQDVKEVVHDVLRHRILLTYEAEAENVTSDKVIDRILNEVPVPSWRRTSRS